MCFFVSGPQGPPGDTGPTGQRGPVGIPGEPGDTGFTGRNGEVGRENTDSNGQRGPTGDAGYTGFTGAPGIIVAIELPSFNFLLSDICMLSPLLKSWRTSSFQYFSVFLVCFCMFYVHCICIHRLRACY